MYKSFADTFTILYSLLNEGLQIPFTLGSKEDTPSVMLFNKLFTNLFDYVQAIHTKIESSLLYIRTLEISDPFKF